jgi:Ca2+-binding EF-hand superfamily protein
MERFSSFFTIFFLSFARNANETNFQMGLEQVNCKELAVGFSFLCAGNKSQKLDEAFKIIGDDNSEFLSPHKLGRFIRSYLRMILGISLVSASPQVNMEHTSALLGSHHLSAHIAGLCYTTEVGSNWALDNFMRAFHAKGGNDKNGIDKISFGDFANWYTDCGYNIVPWLEFLDHSKIDNLLEVHANKPISKEPVVSHHLNSNEQSQQPPGNMQHPQHPLHRHHTFPPHQKPRSHLSPSLGPMNPPTSSGKIRSFDEFICSSPSPHSRKKQTHQAKRIECPRPEPKDILSTFPLSNGRELIVLREDAAYVRAIVEQFGLLPQTPQAVWTKLFSHAKKGALKPLPLHQVSIHKSGSGKSRDLDQKNFVDGVLKTIPSKWKKKKSLPPLAPTAQQTLENFFLSFDMNQVDRVAANQLMGGLSLFCGGSKTNKLSFVFNLFDSNVNGMKKKKTDEIASLCGKDVFYFLRSILIVLFSCCKQSLDLTAGPVGSYIADASNMVTNDIMKYQWRTRKVERINFDEFGQWYNEGGYEVAPWIELLDLDKWAFLDKEKADKMIKKAQPGLKSRLKDTTNTQIQDTSPKNEPPSKKEAFSPNICLSGSPDDVFDTGQDEFFSTDIDIGEIDGFDVDFGFDMPLAKVSDNVLSDSYGGEELTAQDSMNEKAVPAYTFGLSLSSHNHQTLSVSKNRVQVLKTMILESGISETDISALCSRILAEKKGVSISRTKFDLAINSALGSRIDSLPSKNKEFFKSFLSSMYAKFVTKKGGWANANDLACGFIVLCKGRKSEKLEFAFEILDTEKKGWITGSQMLSFLKSFLTVLIHISSCELGDQPAEIAVSCIDAIGNAIPEKDVISEVSSWATEQVFNALSDSENASFKNTTINFDNFADWYTNGGYTNMSWLELLDLEKWILAGP